MKTQTNTTQEVEGAINIKENAKGKLDLIIRLKSYNIQNLLLQKGLLPKRIIGKISIEVAV